MSTLQLRIFDGSRQLFAAPAKFLVTITDGTKTQRVRDFYESNDLMFDLPFFDNFGDNYTVVVYADGYKQAGFMPVTLSNQYVKTLDIMLIPNDPGFSFVNARWDAAVARYPFIGKGVDNAAGAARYDTLLDQQEKVLACLLNLGEAMSQISLSQGTPLDYIKQLRFDAPWAPAQDRFFAWCDPALIDQVKIGTSAGMFAPELNPGFFHPGSTSSWKQIQFGEANVQLTFHENDHLEIDGMDCIMVEPDIDYYKDLGAHAIFEVIPNGLTHSLTDPTEVYVLRWIAGQTAGIPEFAPMYTIKS
ncbi:MAG TPA: hypothetical protein VGG85_02290 [Terracidiphilus sp.]|jgi:hypothetical protein